MQRSVSESLLDGLTGLVGPYGPEKRRLLRMALLNPSVEAWERVYGISVTPRHTLWQVVKALDPNCPAIVTFNADLVGKWGGYFPTSFILRQAFLWAAGQDTNASSHA